jgi:NitT/TauT family transport system substrate-binding protein
VGGNTTGRADKPTRRGRGGPVKASALVLAGLLLAAGCGDSDEASGGGATPGAPDDTTGGGASLVSADLECPAPTDGTVDKYTDLSAASGFSISGSSIWVAMEAGFLEEEGLDVTVDFPGSTPRTVQLLIAGQADSAQPDPGAIINAESQGYDLKAIWTTGTGTFFGFAVHPDSPVTEWTEEQIRGTKIGISEFAGGEVPIVRGALARLGLKEGTDVEFIPIGDGGATTADAIETGRVDVFAGSYPDFAALLSRGVDLRIITPEDIEAFPRNSLAVLGEDYENPEELCKSIRYARALSKAIVFMQTNPEAAADMGRKYAVEQVEGLDLEGVVGVLDGLLLRAGRVFFDDPANTDFYQRVGFMDVDSWYDYQDFLIQGGVEDEEGIRLTEQVPLEGVVVNDHIDEINNFDHAAIEQMARDWPTPTE